MWKAILVILASLLLIMAYPIPAQSDDPFDGRLYDGGLEYWCAEGQCLEFTTFGGKWASNTVTISCGFPTADAAIREWDAYSGLIYAGCSPTPNVVIMVVNPWPYGPNVLGVAGCSFGGGFMVHCTISLRTDTVDHFGVNQHELGHAVGLGHSERDDQLMSPFCCNTIGFDDIAGIQSLYGTGEALPTPTPPFFTPVPTETPTPTPTLTPTATPRPQTIIYRRWLPGLASDGN